VLAFLAPIAGPFLLGALLVVLAGWLTTGSRARRAMGIAVGIAAMTPAWLVPAEHSIVRAAWVIVAFVGAARVIDLGRGEWATADRIVHVLSVVDTRRLTRARPAFDHVALGQAILWELVAWPTFQGIRLAPHFTGAAYWLVRWGFALVFIYTLTEGAYRVLFFAYRAVGFVTPPLHVAPAASRSVQEFWGMRWNRTVGTWLFETFFRPLARRRHPVLGALAAFVVSAVLHAYIEWVAVSWPMALVVLAFFLAQAVIIGLERVLRVRTWSPLAGHAWAIAWMVGLSPLFSEPALRAFLP